jgi:hypothetical protein
LEAVAKSVAGVPIRLTDERWTHITEEHCELAALRLEVLETVSRPESIVAAVAGFGARQSEFEPRWTEEYLRARSQTLEPGRQAWARRTVRDK